MSTTTSNRSAHATEIRSYDDIVDAHAKLCHQVETGHNTDLYRRAARRVARLGSDYWFLARRNEVTDEVHTVAESVMRTVRVVLDLKPTGDDIDWLSLFAPADAWLNHLDLLAAPTR